MTTKDDCVFCRIVAGAIPASTVVEDDDVLAFRDINPQAPTHVLVIPKQHFNSLNDLSRADPALAGKLLVVAAGVADREMLLPDGYRLVINTGTNGGQTVDHVHLHVIGGRSMEWPPG